MANLLYVEYNTGCASDLDYWYGWDSYMSSYYADLEPNTTYTIKRIDTSTRFRLGLSVQDLKYLSSSSHSSVTRPFAWTRQVDSSDAVTFTTDATATHLVVYYTNNSEYSTRVMLNEGSSIEPYEAPTRYFKKWYLDSDNKLMTGYFPDSLDYLTPPYPATLWRLDSDDILTLNSEDWAPFPEPMEYLTPPYPASMWYLDENNKLMNALLPDILPNGAFCNNPNLTEVVLPASLSSIGRESFAWTGLTSVTIPNDTCAYYSTSFPEGCVVTGGHLIE